MTKMKTALAVLALCATAGTAQAAGPQLLSFQASGAGLTDNPFTFGLGLATYNPWLVQSRVTFAVWALDPNITYGVLVEDEFNGVDSSSPNAFTTDSFGRGMYDVVLPGLDVTNNPKVLIYIWDGALDGEGFPDIDELQIVTSFELRATGFNIN